MTKHDWLPDLELRDVRILRGQFRNFSGEERRYNNAGNRNFGVEIPADMAQDLSAQGWPVICLDGGDQYDEPLYFIRVKISYKKRAPKVVMISGSSKTLLTEDTIGMLDWADIVNAKVKLSPNWYDVNGKQGYSAYLNTLYVEIESDPFEDDYPDPPQSEQEEIPF